MGWLPGAGRCGPALATGTPDGAPEGAEGTARSKAASTARAKSASSRTRIVQLFPCTGHQSPEELRFHTASWRKWRPEYSRQLTRSSSPSLRGNVTRRSPVSSGGVGRGRLGAIGEGERDERSCAARSRSVDIEAGAKGDGEHHGKLARAGSLYVATRARERERAS